ncbi:MAG: hypothetical protein LV480_03955 [Methylacidiphilales bacterium]|nr:hypothetical protein [Candidatus Methylacidiphilales bacterium]
MKGKRPFYDPKDGPSNYRKAQEGRFSDHPAFSVCKRLEGVAIGLNRIRGLKVSKKIKLLLDAVSSQMDGALNDLKTESVKLVGRGEKLKFSEAINAYFDPKQPDFATWRVCWEWIEIRSSNTSAELPSRAEFRKIVSEKHQLTFTDEKWKRLLKKTGLDLQILTHAQKQGITLRRQTASTAKRR